MRISERFSIIYKYHESWFKWLRVHERLPNDNCRHLSETVTANVPAKIGIICKPNTLTSIFKIIIKTK